MKKITYLFTIMFSLAILSCSEDSLDLSNPNEPTLDALQSESGLTQYSLGVWDEFYLGINYTWFVQGYHSAMGDEIYIPWGNFGWRYANQVASITLDDNSVVNSPIGNQKQELVARNTRAQGDNNAFRWEWETMYFLNNLTNVILNQLDSGTTQFSGDADGKEKTLRAWAEFWKGYAYMRISSIYPSGPINDVPNETSTEFVSREVLQDEAFASLDAAIAALQSLSGTTGYDEIMSGVIPSFMDSNISPDMWIATMNTMKARMILVNTKRDEMTTAQWNEILNYTSSGLESTDSTFDVTNADANDPITFTTAWLPYRMLIGWHFVSERLVQDFKDGDLRRDRNIVELASPRVNQSGRGINFGTRWGLTDAIDGGDWASTTSGQIKWGIAGSWEENALMRAEALIETNMVDAGLAIIDNVRTAQNAGLPAVSGTGLSLDEAREELRRERRIGLFLRGLSFYDMRRWGINEEVSEGGGRTGAVVLDASGVVNTNAVMNYNYFDYWGVPDNELQFNAPADVSITNPF